MPSATQQLRYSTTTVVAHPTYGSSAVFVLNGDNIPLSLQPSAANGTGTFPVVVTNLSDLLRDCLFRTVPPVVGGVQLWDGVANVNVTPNFPQLMDSSYAPLIAAFPNQFVNGGITLVVSLANLTGAADYITPGCKWTLVYLSFLNPRF